MDLKDGNIIQLCSQTFNTGVLSLATKTAISYGEAELLRQQSRALTSMIDKNSNAALTSVTHPKGRCSADRRVHQPVLILDTQTQTETHTRELTRTTQMSATPK